MKRSILAFASALLFPLIGGCSGGSGSSGGSVPSRVPVLIDTATGGSVLLAGTLQGVVVESNDGGKLAIAMDPPVDLVLAEPGGETSGIDLEVGANPGWRTLYLQLVPGSLVARHGDGKDRPVEVAGSLVEVPIEAGIPAGRAVSLMLRHAAALDLVAEGDRLRWRPSLTATWRDGQVVRDARLKVEAIDVGSRLVQGKIESCGRLKAELHFPDSAVLVLESTGEQLPPDQFLSGLKKGDGLRFDGIASGSGRVEVTAAVHEDERDDRHGKGPRFEVEGSILELQASGETFKLGVTRLRKGSWPKPVPESLTVLAADAKIKFKPGRGQPKGHQPFSVLRPGMQVVVKGYGAPVDGQVTAHKVDIRSQGAAGLLVDLLGQVTEIRLSAPAQIVLVPVAAQEFWIGGKAYPQAIALVDEATVLVRAETGAKMRLIELGDLKTGERCSVLGKVVEGNSLRAALVRVVLP